MWKKILNVIISVTLLASVILAGVQSYRVRLLSQSVEQYRSDLEFARRANKQYADTYRQAKDTNTELGECLSEHVSTLHQLREQLQTIRAGYERMQAILKDLENSGYYYVDNDSTGDSGNRSN